MLNSAKRGVCLWALVVLSIAAIATQLSTRAVADGSNGASVPPWGNTTPWKMPQAIFDETTNKPPSSEDWLRFGWDTFIAMNWPHDEASGNPGAPDVSGDIVTSYNSPANYPKTVWWSYNGKFQLFYELPKGTPNADLYPGEWDAPLSPKPMFDGHQVIGDFSKAGDLSNRLRDQLDEAFIDAPLIDANGKFVMYQIFVNQSFWQYVINTGYYDGSQQSKDVANDAFIGMPKYGNSKDPNSSGQGWYGNLPDYAQQGAMSVKVAWRQLTEDEIDSGRYYTREVYYENNTEDANDLCADPNNAPITVGMVGMHILRLTPTTGQTWFWSSFEHVDNVVGPNASFNAGCAAAASGYTRRGTCIDAVTNIATDPWLTDYPPLNGDDPANYPDGLCGPQSNSTRSQIFRIAETQANLAIGTPVQTTNAEYQAALAGTPWQYYEQINTTQPLSQTSDADCDCFVPPLTDNLINVCDMTNTSMESYSQYNFLAESSSGGMNTELAPVISFENRQAMNCINCHAFSAPVGTPRIAPSNTNESTSSWVGVPTSNHLQVFTFLLGSAVISCSADINLDGDVDMNDLLQVVDAYGNDCYGYCQEDIDDNGQVGIHDILGVLDFWGGCSD